MGLVPSKTNGHFEQSFIIGKESTFVVTTGVFGTNYPCRVVERNELVYTL